MKIADHELLRRTPRSAGKGLASGGVVRRVSLPAFTCSNCGARTRSTHSPWWRTHRPKTPDHERMTDLRTVFLSLGIFHGQRSPTIQAVPKRTDAKGGRCNGLAIVPQVRQCPCHVRRRTREHKAEWESWRVSTRAISAARQHACTCK